MFVLKRRYQSEVAELNRELEAAKSRLAALEPHARELERAAHEFAEWGRYSLEAAAIVLRHSREADSEDLAAIAHAIPYVWSGRRHYHPDGSEYCAESAKAQASAVCAAFGFEMPGDSREATLALFQLAMMILVPLHSLPVEYLRTHYPARGSDGAVIQRAERGCGLKNGRAN